MPDGACGGGHVVALAALNGLGIDRIEVRLVGAHASGGDAGGAAHIDRRCWVASSAVAGIARKVTADVQAAVDVQGGVGNAELRGTSGHGVVALAAVVVNRVRCRWWVSMAGVTLDLRAIELGPNGGRDGAPVQAGTVAIVVGATGAVEVRVDPSNGCEGEFGRQGSINVPDGFCATGDPVAGVAGNLLVPVGSSKVLPVRSNATGSDRRVASGVHRWRVDAASSVAGVAGKISGDIEIAVNVTSGIDDDQATTSSHGVVALAAVGIAWVWRRRGRAMAGVALALRTVDLGPEWIGRVATIESRSVAIRIGASGSVPGCAAGESSKIDFGGQRCVHVPDRQGGLGNDMAFGAIDIFAPGRRLDVTSVRTHAAIDRLGVATDIQRRSGDATRAMASITRLVTSHVNLAVDVQFRVGDDQTSSRGHGWVAACAVRAGRVGSGRWCAVAGVAIGLGTIDLRPNRASILASCERGAMAVGVGAGRTIPARLCAGQESKGELSGQGRVDMSDVDGAGRNAVTLLALHFFVPVRNSQVRAVRADCSIARIEQAVHRYRRRGNASRTVTGIASSALIDIELAVNVQRWIRDDQPLSWIHRGMALAAIRVVRMWCRWC